MFERYFFGSRPYLSIGRSRRPAEENGSPKQLTNHLECLWSLVASGVQKWLAGAVVFTLHCMDGLLQLWVLNCPIMIGCRLYSPLTTLCWLYIIYDIGLFHVSLTHDESNLCMSVCQKDAPSTMKETFRIRKNISYIFLYSLDEICPRLFVCPQDKSHTRQLMNFHLSWKSAPTCTSPARVVVIFKSTLLRQALYSELNCKVWNKGQHEGSPQTYNILKWVCNILRLIMEFFCRCRWLWKHLFWYYDLDS